jgi:hypothetical protein
MARDEPVGRAVAVAVVVAAALVRFHELGSLPLSTAEASSAVIAWDLARGAGTPQAVDPAWSAVSPLLASAQFLLFALLGAASEGLARAPSAVAGTALVLCPWPLRRWLGTPTVLALSALIALDPLCVEASRRAEGGALAILLGAVILVATRRGGDDSTWSGARWWWVTAAVALGLLAVVGTATGTVAPVVLLASLFQRGSRPRGARLRGLASLGAGAALLGASGLLGAWGLVGGVSASLTSWLAGWSSPVSVPGLRAAALFSDPLALVLGGAGLLCLARERRLAVVAAFAAALWWTAWTAPLLIGPVLIAAAAPAVLEIHRRLHAPPGLPSRRAAWIGAILGALGLVGVARGVRIAAPGLDARPPNVAGMDLLGRDVERLSSERAGDARELPVEAVCQPWPDPLLRWTLRDARRLRFHAGSPDPDDRGPALVIGPEASAAGEAPCEMPPARSGSRYQAGPSRLVLWVPRER